MESDESNKSEDEYQIIPPIDLSDFSQEETLRKSFNGTTYLITNSNTDEQFIAKSTYLEINGDKKDQFEDQISQIIHFRHPLILPFCSYSLSNFDDDEDYGTFITKYIPNAISLKDVFSNPKKPPEWTPLKRYFNLLGIAYAIFYAHSNNIIHGNLKPGNILLDSDYNPIITDFCLTSNFSSSEPYDENDDESYKFEDDTPLYIAPEIIESLNEQTPEFFSDTYSYSLIAYELITGQKPFDFSKSGFDNYYQYSLYIKKEKIRPDLSIIKDWKIESFLSNCWDENPHNRKNFLRILNELNNECFAAYFRLKSNSDEIKEFKEKLLNSQPLQFHLKGQKYIPISLISSSQKLYEYQLNESSFEWEETVGEGSFAQVTVIIEKATGTKFAAKKSTRTLGSLDHQRDFFKEVEFLFYINHPAVLEICGYFFHHEGKKDVPIIVTNYMKNKSLNDWTPTNLEWTPTKRLINLIGIAYGIEYIHSLNIIHMDLKPGNILLDDNFYPKIADFGDSIIVDNEKDIIEEMGKSYGTPIYSAPELTICSCGSKIDPYKVDVFSFSMIAYELITGQKPFIIDKKMEQKELHQIMNDMADKNLRPDLSIITSDEIKNFLEKCWQNDSSQRFSSKEVVEEIEFNMKIFEKEFGPDLNKEEIDLYIQKLTKKKSSDEIYAASVKEEADKGDTFAALLYAKMRFFGDRVAVNKKEAAVYYQRAADEGNIEALEHFISMLRNGEGVDVNEEKACYYEQLLVEERKIRDEMDVAKDDATSYFKSEADKGNVIAMNYYAELMYDGDGLTSNKKEAAKYFKMAADSFINLEPTKTQSNQQNNQEQNVDDVDIKNNQKQNVDDVDIKNNQELNVDDVDIKNKSKKNEILNENDQNNIKEHDTESHSTNNNDQSSDNNNNDQSSDNNDDFPGKKIEQDDELEIVFSSSNQLALDSMVKYSSMLSHGEGVHVNKRESARYLKIAADNGDIDACCKLGKILFKGEGVRSNLQLAIHYFSRAFDDDGDFVGNSDAMNFYGYMASNGLGMKSDKKLAARLYKMASDQGNPYAMNNYGFMLSNGVELKVDKESAAKYYKLAADQGNKDAMINYGNMLYRGDGIETDLELAAYYYHMALNC